MRLVFVLVAGVAAAVVYAIAAPDDAPVPAPTAAAIVEPPPDRGALPVSHPPIDQPQNGRVLEGVVAEVLQVQSYTYLRLTLASGGEAWAAVTRTELAPGARVRVREEVEMRGFASPSLGRTFERVSFGALEP